MDLPPAGCTSMPAGCPKECSCASSFCLQASDYPSRKPFQTGLRAIPHQLSLAVPLSVPAPLKVLVSPPHSNLSFTARHKATRQSISTLGTVQAMLDMRPLHLLSSKGHTTPISALEAPFYLKRMGATPLGYSFGWNPRSPENSLYKSSSKAFFSQPFYASIGMKGLRL